jgi:preprotein translocase subunit SecY
MLTAVVRAFQTPDLRKKLLFTGAMIVLFRFGANLPAPGISERNVLYCSGLLASSGNSLAPIYAVLNVLSGNALQHMTVFALTIMPYITASIILQLLTQVVPRLEALFPGTSCSATDHPLIPHPDMFTIITMVITMVSGTPVIMWMGELITDRGIGNGMSVLIFTTVIAAIPGEFEQIYLTKGLSYAVSAGAVVIAVVVFIVFMEQAQRRIPIHYAKRMTGRRMYGGTSTYLPLKVNQAGVVPVIFASSLLQVPILAASLFGDKSHPQGWYRWVQSYLQPGDSKVYLAAFFGLIVGFTHFYVSVTFNPAEVADNMRKYGGFIPGIRPGQPTAGYLRYVLSRLTAPGSVYLGVVAMFPLVILGLIGVSSQLPFSGVSLLIMVGVGLDTVKQIESQLQLHNYEGFLR